MYICIRSIYLHVSVHTPFTCCSVCNTNILPSKLLTDLVQQLFWEPCTTRNFSRKYCHHCVNARRTQPTPPRPPRAAPHTAADDAIRSAAAACDFASLWASHPLGEIPSASACAKSFQRAVVPFQAAGDKVTPGFDAKSSCSNHQASDDHFIKKVQNWCGILRSKRQKWSLLVAEGCTPFLGKATVSDLVVHTKAVQSPCASARIPDHSYNQPASCSQLSGVHKQDLLMDSQNGPH